MKYLNKKMAVVALVVSAFAGCANQTFTGSAYSGDQTRQTQIIQRGTVTEVRNIDIVARQTGIGALTGGALGGIAGSKNGGTGSDKSAATAIVGMVIGGLVGNAVDKNLSTLKGQEITIVLTSGVEIAISQEVDEKEGPFNVGERVRILSGGGTTRVTR